MKDNVVRLVAVGDVHPNRQRPEETFEQVQRVLDNGDIRYCQLECTLSDLGVLRSDVRNPAHRVPPENVRALSTAGFDIVSFASNNALDYGIEPFLDTISRLKEHRMTVIGAGHTLGDARAYAIVERYGVRVAFLNACSILRDGYAATPTRAGISPLYVRTFYEPLENIYEQPGTPPRTWTFADPSDLEAVLKAIETAKQEAHIVVACFHWGVHFTHDLAMYQAEVAYDSIDAGADLIIGTHPHCLQAFDVYKGRIIAYSLGNFVFEQDEKASRDGVSDYLSFYGIPIDLETPRVPHPKHTKLTGLLVCEISNGQFSRVAFKPAVIDRDARPRLLTSQEPLFHEVTQLVGNLSSELGTDLHLDDQEIVIRATKSRAIDTRRLLRARKISYPSLRRLATLAD